MAARQKASVTAAPGGSRNGVISFLNRNIRDGRDKDRAKFHNRCPQSVPDAHRVERAPDKDDADEEGEEPFFIIMSRILQNKSKREEFVNQIIKGDVLKKDSDILKEFKKATNYVADYYDDELDAEEKAFSKLGKSKEYKNFIKNEDLLYPKGKTRKFTYTTVPNSEIEENKKRILNLYSTTNINTDNKTFNGKIKFDS